MTVNRIQINGTPNARFISEFNFDLAWPDKSNFGQRD